MAYFAWTVWLLVIVFTAWGVRELLAAVIKPKALNVILLPGTLVGVAGHVLGLLITGGTIRDTTLIKDDDSGAPATTTDPKPRIPVIGPILVGMLPLLACASAIYLAAVYFGPAVLKGMKTDVVGPVLPVTFAGFWELLRAQITLVESFLTAVARANLANWQTLVFLYLAVCLTIRMAPFPGTSRGTLGATVVLGLAAAFCTWAFGWGRAANQVAWPVVNLLVATCFALLLTALLIRGTMLLVRLVRGAG